MHPEARTHFRPSDARRDRLPQEAFLGKSNRSVETSKASDLSRWRTVAPFGIVVHAQNNKGRLAAPFVYSAFGSGFEMAIVSPASPTLNRAKRLTEMFSPSLPILVAMSCEIEMVWSLMKGCSYRQTSP